MIYISPPPNAVEERDIAADERQKLFLVGDRDRIAPAHQLQVLVANMASEATRISIVPGFDHQWAGGETLLGRTVADFFAANLT